MKAPVRACRPCSYSLKGALYISVRLNDGFDQRFEESVPRLSLDPSHEISDSRGGQSKGHHKGCSFLPVVLASH